MRKECVRVLLLLQVMREFGVFNIVFSSSATVYGMPQYLPMDEDHPAGQCTSPYGRTKFFIEQILMDVAAADKVMIITPTRHITS